MCWVIKIYQCKGKSWGCTKFKRKGPIWYYQCGKTVSAPGHHPKHAPKVMKGKKWMCTECRAMDHDRRMSTRNTRPRGGTDAPRSARKDVDANYDDDDDGNDAAESKSGASISRNANTSTRAGVQLAQYNSELPQQEDEFDISLWTDSGSRHSPVPGGLWIREVTTSTQSSPLVLPSLRASPISDEAGLEDESFSHS